MRYQLIKKEWKWADQKDVKIKLLLHPIIPQYFKHVYKAHT